MIAFSVPEVQRGLASLPLDERLDDGFHRRFIARHAPEVAPGPGPAQRAGLPPFARRLASAARDLRTHHATGDRIDLDPELRDWLTEILASPILVEPLGMTWAERVRRR